MGKGGGWVGTETRREEGERERDLPEDKREESETWCV